MREMLALAVLMPWVMFAFDLRLPNHHDIAKRCNRPAWLTIRNIAASTASKLPMSAFDPQRTSDSNFGHYQLASSPLASVAITCFSNLGVTEISPVNGRL
jgi:hypothetical protein